MTKYSILDLSPVPEGSDAKTALRDSVTLAQDAEKLGYHRFWLAEHHNIPTIASAANTVIIGQILAATKRLIVGAGGVMLPNHSTLVVAEQNGTLAAYYPDRVDLGLGRASGTDMATARALGRHLKTGEDFPNEVIDLISYLDGSSTDGVTAIPASGTKVPVWILGTSLFGAELAAKLGLPYVFASHFAPGLLSQAKELFTSTFKPSQRLSKPYFMMSVGIYAADSNQEAERISTSTKLHFAQLRTGNIGKLAYPVDDIASLLPSSLLAGVEHNMSVTAIGDPKTVTRQLDDIITRYRPDEVMVSAMIHDPVARKRSFEIAAQAFQKIGAKEPA